MGPEEDGSRLPGRHPSLKGRILFTNAEAGTADAAFIEQNDAPAEAIKALSGKAI